LLKPSSSQFTKLLASSSATESLSPGLATIAMLAGHLLLCILAMLNGYVGCKYGINFSSLDEISARHVWCILCRLTPWGCCLHL